MALFAVSSSPLFLGNDPRENRMSDRAVGLLLNPDMIEINQQYSERAAFAGGRSVVRGTAPPRVFPCFPPLCANRGSPAILPAGACGDRTVPTDTH